MERPLQRFLQRFPDARNAPGVAKVLAGQVRLLSCSSVAGRRRRRHVRALRKASKGFVGYRNSLSRPWPGPRQLALPRNTDDHRLTARFPCPHHRRPPAAQASLDEVAAALEGVLTQPIYTLALGDALRATGSLLRLLSYLVERRLSADLAATPSADGGASGAFAVMLVTILELAPQCGRCVAACVHVCTVCWQLAKGTRELAEAS